MMRCHWICFPYMEWKFCEFGEFKESDKSLKHEIEFKNPLCYLCLATSVVTSWSLTQGWQVRIILSVINFYVTDFCDFGEHIPGKLKCQLIMSEKTREKSRDSLVLIFLTFEMS